MRAQVLRDEEVAVRPLAPLARTNRQKPEHAEPVRVLVVHNFYQSPGGEDQVFRQEVAMLKAKGHSVSEFTIHNDQVNALNKWDLARKTFWNDDVFRQLTELIRQERPSIAHFHNTFPLISPAGYYAARMQNIAVVQMVHNYRLICPKAIMYRNGHLCEQCIDRTFAWPSIVHRCYRGSALASGLTAAMITYHRLRGTWDSLVDVYIAATDFSRKKLIEGGLSGAKIVVKPNFLVDDLEEGPGGGGYVAYVGRLVPEKGVATLLKAWSLLGGPIQLKIVGDGPMRETVKAAAEADPRIEFMGFRSRAEVQAVLSRAEIMVFPSEWYEPFPLTMIEAFAAGTPVVAASIAHFPDLVRLGKTGRLFRPGDARSLADEVKRLFAIPSERRAMRACCRRTYEEHFTAERNYPILMGAYRKALNERA
jgi:glycosyltransferase involved in cell wall biosynthesis